MSVQVTKPSRDRTTELQSKLYQAAKRDPSRRFHALYDRLSLGVCPADGVGAGAEEPGRRRASTSKRWTQIEALGVGEFLAEIAQSLREKTYRPQPVRRVEIPKGDGQDRARWASRPCGTGWCRRRPSSCWSRSSRRTSREAPSGSVRGWASRKPWTPCAEHARQGYRWVVDADIEQFFDTLDHQQLMAALRRRISDGEMLRLIYRWLKAGYLLDGEYHDTDQGSPQGGVLSPLLANVYLHALRPGAAEPRSRSSGGLTRYADDFVIQCGTAEHAARALEWVREQMAALGLRLHPEKTRVVNDREEGFDFLGFHHRRVVLAAEAEGSRGACCVGRAGKHAASSENESGSAWSHRAHTRQRMGESQPARCGPILPAGCHYYRHGESAPRVRETGRVGASSGWPAIWRAASRRAAAGSGGTGRNAEASCGASGECRDCSNSRHAKPAAVSWAGECPVESRVRENLTHGSGRGRWKRRKPGGQGPICVGTDPKGRKRSSRMQVLPSQATPTAPTAYSTPCPGTAARIRSTRSSRVSVRQRSWRCIESKAGRGRRAPHYRNPFALSQFRVFHSLRQPLEP